MNTSIYSSFRKNVCKYFALIIQKIINQKIAYVKSFLTLKYLKFSNNWLTHSKANENI